MLRRQRWAIGCWMDTDGDGVQDPDEVRDPGGDGRPPADLDGDGVYSDVVGTTTTDATGNYIFDGLAPGAYVVEVTDTPTCSPATPRRATPITSARPTPALPTTTTGRPRR